MFVPEQNSYNALIGLQKPLAFRPLATFGIPQESGAIQCRIAEALRNCGPGLGSLRHQTSFHCVLMPTPERLLRVERARQRLQAARVRAQECKEKTEKMVSKAIALLEKYDLLETRAASKLGKRASGQRAQKTSNHDALGMLPAMKQALANVERVVMVPSDDKALRTLKSDLRSAVAKLQFNKIVSRYR
jgi:hypothetical protein